MEVSTVESSQNFYHIIFGVTYATTAFAIPFVLICFIYYSICVAASGNNKRARTSVLSNEENSQMIRNKLQGVGSETESPGAKLPEDNRLLEKSVNVSDDNRESTRLNEGNRLTSNPSFVVTRPSPPNPQIREPEVDPDFKRVDKDVAEDVCETEVAQMIAGNKFPGKENSLKVKTECEVPLLKPTLKNNSSFTKLSTLHIQFSNSTEKITEKNPAERRHSNILLGTVDPEFENIGKSRSSSMESNFYEISSRSSFSTRSTTTSNQIQSSRSSSLNSTYARLPPSRASSIRSTSSYIVHNIRHRISNASLFRYREETRAARISAMVIVMALLCWLPFFIVISLYPGICLGKFPHFPYYLDAFSIVLLLASTIISPFLFAFRNRQIKKEIRKIFQFCPNSNWNCTKSFYTHNFSLSLKSQTVQLLTELGKGTNTKPKNGHAGCSS